MASSRSALLVPVCMLLALIAVAQPATAANAAFGIFDDSTCMTFSYTVPSVDIGTGICKGSVTLGTTYYRINAISDSSFSYNLGCDSTCTTCTTSGTAAPGTCISAPNGKYVTAHPIKATTILSNIGEAGCNSTTSSTVPSGTCTNTASHGPIRMIDIGQSRVWYNYGCDSVCSVCKIIGRTTAGSPCTSLALGTVIDGYFSINSSASLTASVTLIGMAAAILSAFTVLG
ncbi:hypothetical protein CAOG_00992 [Capsaspora owczarzaki ATCC 30864]|uniref:Uncharacterized protein n=1 Tax=Capsaspora owczarzaki (strain ATCC 30864) TaxID=595528 RepID=A0A0D2WJJ7_CAPO3|nr:hypothetical protein CAOG_00992 [Capsaspora owczarzaki ATCC 30864]KJE89543.1 hypothetical protein CAOG_000992 [Capsaspora owczarzaki ATCC 30864]|eukprot:XP_004365863.1 hypothetical protein CAOG_00992 [Capsaspora owczarzaki ATCC 30864]